MYVYNKDDKWIVQFSNPIVLGEKGLGLGGGLISLSIDNVPLKKDDLHSVNYNKLLQKDTATKDYNSHEDMLLQQIYYKWGLVVNYNTDKPVPEMDSVFLFISGTMIMKEPGATLP